MKRAAIYSIRNTINGKVYIGSSKHVPRRLYIHRYLLEKGRHTSRALQRSWDKHGAAVFDFSVLEDVADPATLLNREQYWIDHFKSADGVHGYNGCPVAGSREGSAQPASVSATLSAFHKGKPKSAETRAKMSAAAKRLPPKSEATREKLRAATARQYADPANRVKAAEYGRLAKRRPV